MNRPLANLSASQLLRAASIKTQIEALQNKLQQLLGEKNPSAPSAATKKRRAPRLSKAARARIAAAQKKRWAKVKRSKK